MSTAISARRTGKTAHLRREAAEARWEELRSGFVNAERTLTEIIKNRDWLDLGYGTFAQAWVDRLQGIRLAQQGLKAVVVQQLIEEGLSDPEIVETIGVGIGSYTVARMRKSLEAGVPVSHVRSFDRALPRPADCIIVPLPADEVARYKQVCEAAGKDWRAEAAAAIRSSLSGIERAKR